MVGILDHQVNVERDGTHVREASHNRQTKGQIGDKVAIHDVHVQQIRRRDFRDVAL
jgi:hypothetical protein